MPLVQLKLKPAQVSKAFSLWRSTFELQLHLEQLVGLVRASVPEGYPQPPRWKRDVCMLHKLGRGRSF